MPSSGTDMSGAGLAQGKWAREEEREEGESDKDEQLPEKKRLRGTNKKPTKTKELDTKATKGGKMKQKGKTVMKENKAQHTSS